MSSDPGRGGAELGFGGARLLSEEKITDFPREKLKNCGFLKKMNKTGNKKIGNVTSRGVR